MSLGPCVFRPTSSGPPDLRTDRVGDDTSLMQIIHFQQLGDELKESQECGRIASFLRGLMPCHDGIYQAV